MVSSQVHPQHPSHLVFPSVRQHTPWVPKNADVHCRELETSEVIWRGNTTPDGHSLCSKGYACPGHADITSPFNSSWIQRLIPSQNTRVEQPQPSDTLNRVNHGIDGLQTNWKESADHCTILGNQFDFPVYENSRRSEQDFFSTHQTSCGINSPLCMENGVNIRPFEAPDTLPPEIQVLPKPLPVVECLLPGHTKKVRENQTCPETNMPHVLSRSTGFANPMEQTVLYSANEKSRVSCSAIEAPNTCSVLCAAGDLFALKSLQQAKRCIGPSQPCSEFSFSNGAFTLNMDSTYGDKDRQTGTTLRTYKNSTQTEDAFVTLCNESRYFDSHKVWASSVPRCPSVENRLLDGYSMPNICWNPKKHHGYAHDGSEPLYAREGSLDGGWLSLPYKEKDEPRQVSNLVPLQCGSNVAKEKAGIHLSHRMIEQDLDSSRGTHEEQGGTSRSFSFHFENRLAPEDHSKVGMRKGQWPFGPSTLSNQDLGQSRWSEDNKVRGLAKATRLGIPFDNSSFFQETGVREVGIDCIGRSQSSPFFGTENLNKSSSCRVFNNHDILPYKAACIDIGGVFGGHMKTEAVPGNSVDHVMQTLKGRHPLARLESNSMIEGIKGKEPMLSFPSRTVSVKNWKAFKPSSQRSTPTCPPEGAQSNHADGNCASVNHWQVFKPPIRSSSYTFPREAAQVNNADGNSCSIGSCSKRPSKLSSEDASTSADARSQFIAPEKQLHGSQRQCAGTGVNTAPDDEDSAGKEAISCEASGSDMKQNIWMKRWSAMRSRKVQDVSRPNREGGVLAGTTQARNYIEDHYTSQASQEFSHHLDFRPAKRICFEKRSGPYPELGNAVSKAVSVAVGKEHNEKAVASHFMKRFFTPSVAAMAIMGMTARKVHATQPQKSGLFGVWASNALSRKPSGGRAEVCKEFITTPDCKKEISPIASKALPTPVDL